MDIRSKAQLVIEDAKQAREDILKRKERLSSAEKASDKNKLQAAQSRLTELDRLIVSVYDDKVFSSDPTLAKIPTASDFRTVNFDTDFDTKTYRKRSIGGL